MKVIHFIGGGKDLVTSTSEKYDKILQAAIEVISEKGLDKTSISDIVKRAGVAQGTFIFISDPKCPCSCYCRKLTFFVA